MNIFTEQFMDKWKSMLTKHPLEKAAQIYIFLMLVLFPLFYTDKMFHLYLDKRNFFLFFSAIFLCIVFPAALTALYNWGNNMYTPKKADTIFALVLLSAIIISTVFALNTRKTFFEMSSRTISGLCFLICLGIFFAIRKYGTINNTLLWIWITGSSLLYLFGILCACGINVLHIQDGLSSKDLPVYLTPLSNTNFNTCYVCLMLPPIMVMYIISQKHLSQILCGINLYLGFLFTLFIKTDSSVIAIIFGIILLGYFSLEANSWSEQYIQMIGIYIVAKLTIRILLTLFPEKLYSFEGLGIFLLNTRLLLCEIICYLIFIILWRRKSNILRKRLTSARKILVIIGFLLGSCFFLCVIFANINSANLSKGSLLQHLVLTESTFTGRGFVWMKTISVLRNESIGRKLIGNGLNSFRTLMRITRALPLDSGYADPHNELMQITADMGILGAIGYFGLIFTPLIKGLKNWRRNNLHIISVLTLTIYAVQGLANGYSIYTLPLLFIFLGLVNKL